MAVLCCALVCCGRHHLAAGAGAGAAGAVVPLRLVLLRLLLLCSKLDAEMEEAVQLPRRQEVLLQKLLGRELVEVVSYDQGPLAL